MTITRKQKLRKINGRFLSVPISVLDSRSYRELSFSASRLLMIIHWQYNGRNNGDLSAPLSRTKLWGIKSSATLTKALKELERAELIVRTRDPTRDRTSPHGQCSLFALTWCSMDDCNGKHDYRPTKTPIRKFSMRAG